MTGPSAQRFLDRFLPAEERADALWIAGAGAGLWVAKALVYQQLLGLTTRFVRSPRAEELGFPLRATAIADVAWGAVAALLVWGLLRYTRAPKAVALFILLAGVLGGLVTAGNRVALDVVQLLASSGYQRTIWSDLQPLMLTLAEAVGVVLGAWMAGASPEARAIGLDVPAVDVGGDGAEDRDPLVDGGTLLPALGLGTRPLVPATRMAIAFAGAVSLSQLIWLTVMFAPQARTTVLYAHGGNTAGRISLALAVLAAVAWAASPGLVTYWAIKRLGAPHSVWIAFPAIAIAPVVTILRTLPAMIERTLSVTLLDWTFVLAQVGSVVLSVVVLTLSPLLGVWLATRTSPPSATLPAEETDHADAGGTDG